MPPAVGYITNYDAFLRICQSSDVWLSFLGTLIFASGESRKYLDKYAAIFVSQEALEAESRL